MRLDSFDNKAINIDICHETSFENIKHSLSHEIVDMSWQQTIIINYDTGDMYHPVKEKVDEAQFNLQA